MGEVQKPDVGSVSPKEQTTYSEDEDFFCDFQLFDEHCEQSERFRKTLYYGELPKYTDRPSLALTSLAIEFFRKSLPPRDELRFLDMEYASRVMRNACVTPASLVVALMYADRIRRKNPQYLAQTNSCDLFLVSMMVASKFLYDDGADDEVFNEAWAKAADLETTQLNREERHFLNAIQWNLFVRPNEFRKTVSNIERCIAVRELSKRQRTGSTSTYTDLDVLTKEPQALNLLYEALSDYVFKVITVSMVGYCACLLTVVASMAAVQFMVPLTEFRDETTTSTTTAPTKNQTICPFAVDSPFPSETKSVEHEEELLSVFRGECFINDKNLQNGTDGLLLGTHRARAKVTIPLLVNTLSWSDVWDDYESTRQRDDHVSHRVFPFSRAPPAKIAV